MSSFEFVNMLCQARGLVYEKGRNGSCIIDGVIWRFDFMSVLCVLPHFRFDSKTHEDLGLICFVKEVQNIAISRIYTVVQDEKTVVQWQIDPVDIGGTGKLGVQ